MIDPFQTSTDSLMDRRSIIFYIALTATLLGVNAFFQYLNRDEIRKWNEQQKARIEKQEAVIEADIAEKSIPLSDLPIVEIYSVDEERIASGVMTNGSVLTLSFSPQVPETVLVRPLGSSGSFTKVNVTVSPEKIGRPALFGQKLLSADLPSVGNYDLQLFQPGIDPKATVVEYSDGNFAIPLQKLRKKVGSGIVLMKTDKGFLPAAFFDATNGKFTLLSHIPDLSASLSFEKRAEVKVPAGQEQFYVLENDFQQLVFSNIGGALAEVNLPFKTDKNQQSVVREVQVDRDMIEHHPMDAQFPLRPYITANEKGERTSHEKGKLGGYTPLIRRTLFEKGQAVKLDPAYYALNTVSEYPELAKLVYEVKAFDSKKIVFEAKQNMRTITKTYSIAQEDVGAPYVLDVEIGIEGDARGLWLSSGVPEVEMISSAPAPDLKMRTSQRNKSVVEVLKLPKETLTVTTALPDWITTANGFFGIILDPLSSIDTGYRLQAVSGTVVPSRLAELEANRYSAENMPGYMVALPLKAKKGQMKFRIFAGPLSEKILNQVDTTFSDPKTGYNPDYSSVQSYHGFFAFVSEPFARFMNMLMKLFYQITGSWGFSIILLTIALKIILYPLNSWSAKSMIKFQEVAPKLKAIDEKFKKDPMKAQMAKANLMRESGANPMMGCFPMLIQLPFLLGMFGLLKTSFALRGAPFIPGWIDDLSAPDVLFSWGRSFPLIGNSFHLLPVLLGAVMYFQSKMTQKGPKDVNNMTEQERQSLMMGRIMPIMFTAIFYNFPSGLNIYWLFSSLFGIGQQWLIQKQMKAAKSSDEIELEVKDVK
jgi:YidC/Oxa1 family membrane protein insertase